MKKKNHHQSHLLQTSHKTVKHLWLWKATMLPCKILRFAYKEQQAANKYLSLSYSIYTNAFDAMHIFNLYQNVIAATPEWY